MNGTPTEMLTTYLRAFETLRAAGRRGAHALMPVEHVRRRRGD